MEEEKNDITYYIIHLDKHVERKVNITRNELKLGKKIIKFDAVDCNDVDLFNLKQYDSQLQNNFNYRFIGEIGNYLSHFMLLKCIHKRVGYSVIFEDDLSIITINLSDKINHLVKIIDDDFDLLFLGNLNNNHSNHCIEDIYHVDKANELYGVHAYLVNNKNIDKICNGMHNMDKASDNKYKELIDNKTLNGYVVYPILVDQNTELKSTIR